MISQMGGVMKRRGFLGRLVGGVGVLVVADKVIEGKPIEPIQQPEANKVKHSGVIGSGNWSGSAIYNENLCCYEPCDTTLIFEIPQKLHGMVARAQLRETLKKL